MHGCEWVCPNIAEKQKFQITIESRKNGIFFHKIGTTSKQNRDWLSEKVPKKRKNLLKKIAL